MIFFFRLLINVYILGLYIVLVFFFKELYNYEMNV